jgi:hypothetical protein
VALDLGPHPSGRPVGLFRLLALATLAEAGDPGAARRVFEALEAAGVLEGMLLAGRPLEDALAVAASAGATAAQEERLVHLVRYRLGLLGVPAAVLAEPRDARAWLTLLRAHVTGPTLGTGLVLVLREAWRRGVWSGPGLGEVPLPW